MTRIASALRARLDNVKKNEQGFTLIELLVVVIIIGILAAIAIPVFIGVQNNAKLASVKSDLGNAKTAVVAYYTANPAAATADLTPGNLADYGWKTTTGNTITLQTTPAPTSTAFCISGYNDSIGATDNTFHVDANGSIADGACP